MKEVLEQSRKKNPPGLRGKALYLGHGANLIYANGVIIDPLRILPETNTDPVAAAKAVNDFQQLGRTITPTSIVEVLRSKGEIHSGKYEIHIMGADDVFTATSEKDVDDLIGFAIGLKIADRLRKATPQNPRYESPTCSIAGSFRFKKDIDAMIQDVSTQGITVLAPPKGDVLNKKDDFKILEGNLDLGEADIEAVFIQKMSEADALYVYAKDGYVGRSVKAELRFAIECGIPIFLSEPLKVNLGKYDIGKNGKSIGREIPIISPSEFSNLMKQDSKHKEAVFQEQFWYRKQKGRLRIFGFTNDRLMRSVFIDMRDVYADPIDLSLTIKRISRIEDLLAPTSYCTFSSDQQQIK